MKLSIIVPIYKIEKYLNPCIDSVLKQSYKDYELILVDDGSPDNCGKICDEYAAKNNQIKVVHKENGGLSSARNAGTEVAKGEFLFFLDGDDFLEEESLKKLMDAINNTNADMYTFANFDYDEDGNKKLVTNISNKIFNSVNELYKEMIKEVGYFKWEVWRYLFRRSVVEKNNLKARLDVKITEDCDFTNRYLQKVNSIYAVNIPVVNYRVSRAGSAMTQKDKEKCLDEIRNGKEFFVFYSEHKDMPDVANYFEKYYYGKIKKMIALFELDEKDEIFINNHKIRPRKVYGKIFEFFLKVFGYKGTEKLLKKLKKIKRKLKGDTNE